MNTAVPGNTIVSVCNTRVKLSLIHNCQEPSQVLKGALHVLNEVLYGISVPPFVAKQLLQLHSIVKELMKSSSVPDLNK